MAKIVDTLRIFAENRDGLFIHEVAEKLGLKNTTQAGFIPNMKYTGYIEQIDGKYKITEYGLKRLKFEKIKTSKKKHQLIK